MTVHSRIKVSSPSSSSSSSSSAEVVGSIDDLLVEILLLLPVKSLVRFQSVSKKWKFLITGSCFSFRHSPGPNPSPATGLFLCGARSVAFDYLHFDVQNPSNPPFKELNFPDDPHTFWIHHAHKGLLLCCSTGGGLDNDSIRRRSPIRTCYILNPTLNIYVKLPRPGVTYGVPRYVHGVTLAFDPAHPPYRVVCVRGSELAPDVSQIEIYSTETSEWSLAGKPFRADVDFQAGVYWNGSVHWLHSKGDKILYFNIDQETFGTLSLPEVSNDYWIGQIEYLGESYDKLQLVINYEGIELRIYEMERVAGATWSAKYQVDLRTVIDALPGTISAKNFEKVMRYKFSIFHVVRGENEFAFLFTKIVNKVVRFDLERDSCEEILELQESELEHHFRAFEYIQSLSMFPCPVLNRASE